MTRNSVILGKLPAQADIRGVNEAFFAFFELSSRSTFGPRGFRTHAYRCYGRSLVRTSSPEGQPEALRSRSIEDGMSDT